MQSILGMPASSFYARITTEPVLVLKTVLLYWYLQLCALFKKKRLDVYVSTERDDLTVNNVLVPPVEELLDYPQKDLDDQTGDTIFLFGGSSKKDLLVAKITRKKHHNELFLHLRLSDGRRYEPPNSEKIYAPSAEFVAGGLRIKVRTALRKSRLSFNGLLREFKPGDLEGQLVHVKFSFVVATSCFPFDLKSDVHPSILSEYLAKQDVSLFSSNITKATDILDSVVQAVNFFGTVTVDGSDEIETPLWGARKRSKEVFPASKRTQISEFFGHTKDGQLIYSGECALPTATSKLPFGYYLERSTIAWPIRKCELTFKGKQPTFNGMKIYLENDRRSVTASVSAPTSSTCWRGTGSETKAYFSNFTLQDGDEGFAVFLENTWGVGQTDELQKPAWPMLGDDRTRGGNAALVLPLESVPCQDSSLSGGKGSSLATLTSLAKRYDTGFKVPSGFVVTTKAYQRFYAQAGVEAQVAEFEKNAWSYSNEKIKETCEIIVNQVSKAQLPDSIRKAVERQLREQFPQDGVKKRFAVRSSAAGEDSEEMSAAGQMSTLLGMEGFETICQAIVKCWASQFSFTAIQYKRQNGQELNSLMAVVVQEMVPADVAGVLFTCDPVTGNPQNVTVTANYGLGESVVSAAADPDTLVYHRKESNQVSIKSTLLGKKTTKIVMADAGSVEELRIEQSDSDTCCLNEENGLRLAAIGLKIEESYGFPVDIEWAFKDNQLYMLQARPITTFDMETKYEISHATTSPIRAEDEYNTKANVGEVMPRATSHLGISFISHFFFFCIEFLYGKRNKYAFPFDPFYTRMVNIRNHTFISMPNFILRFYKKGEQSFLSQSNIIAGFGRILDDERMFDQADKRNQMYPTSFMPIQLLYFLSDFIFGERRLNKAVDQIWNKEMDLKGCRNSKELYERLWKQVLQYESGVNPHLVCSMNSSIFNSIALGILATENKGWDTKVFSDFALILSSCGDLESADIPRAMKLLSAEIRSNIGAEKFKEMSPEEALVWLENTTTSAGRSYHDFIHKHGHRCLKEFDVYTKPWRVNRLPLVKAIQDFIGQKNGHDKRFISVDEVMDNLQVKLSTKNRIILRLLIPLCRKGVFGREKSKGLVIKVMDHCRKAWCALSEQMVKEGRLPDKELLFFLTYQEIYELIRSRSPSLVQSAIRRRQLYPELDKMDFPEICTGLPKSLQELRNEREEEEFVADLEMKGTPVSQGSIKAFARVATTIEEAADIKAGEILIAYSTDIAWSPYFPLLSGVATELGGLISHGAVVAREYGLPCVVGVHDATIKFKTGDFILLDGNKGLLKRLERSQPG